MYSIIVVSTLSLYQQRELLLWWLPIYSSMGIQAHAHLWAMFIKLETSLQHLIQQIRLLQVLNVEQSSTSLPRIYCNLSTQPCCYEFHCKYDTDSVLYHFLLGVHSLTWLLLMLSDYVQTGDLPTPYPSLMVWSASAELLQDLRQCISVMMGFIRMA